MENIYLFIYFRIFSYSTQAIATAINTIAENGSESNFNEIFHSLKEKFYILWEVRK